MKSKSFEVAQVLFTKAGHDLQAAELLMAEGASDVACFPLQQYVEKLLKANLQVREFVRAFCRWPMGRVKFEPSHLYGVFAQLNNPDVFSRVDVSEGFARWSGDIDFAPDAMCQVIKRDGVWVLS